MSICWIVGSCWALLLASSAAFIPVCARPGSKKSRSLPVTLSAIPWNISSPDFFLITCWFSLPSFIIWTESGLTNGFGFGSGIKGICLTAFGSGFWLGSWIKGICWKSLPSPPALGDWFGFLLKADEIQLSFTNDFAWGFFVAFFLAMLFIQSNRR